MTPRYRSYRIAQPTGHDEMKYETENGITIGTIKPTYGNDRVRLWWNPTDGKIWADDENPHASTMATYNSANDAGMDAAIIWRGDEWELILSDVNTEHHGPFESKPESIEWADLIYETNSGVLVVVEYCMTHKRARSVADWDPLNRRVVQLIGAPGNEWAVIRAA